MRSIVAICEPDAYTTTRQIVGPCAGTRLVPPYEAMTRLAVGCPDALYVDLDGREGGPGLYTSDGRLVISERAIRAAGLGGAVVFLTACHAPESGTVGAFLAGGAGVVIAGSGENATVGTRGGASLLALHWFDAYRRGLSWRLAWWWARLRLYADWRAEPQNAEWTLDALQFVAFR